MLEKTGIEDKRLVVLVESHMVINDLMYFYLNTLLSQGMIPGLWSPEELESNSSLSADARAAGKSVGDIFQSRTKSNIRIVLATENDSTELKNCWNQCPQLSKNAKILVFKRWETETSASVARSHLKSLFGSETEKLVEMAARLHQDHGWNPGQFQSLLGAIRAIYNAHKDQLKNRKEKLIGGLTKLEEAEKTVAELEENVTVQKKELEEKRTEADAALQSIQERV